MAPQAKNVLIPAVAYYRMSSDQQEASIGDQRIAVEKYAAANGYYILREYCDEAISGWREDRKGFQQLIADAPRGEFKAVLCWDQDRFSRFPVLEANHYWFLLERAGVHIAAVAQGKLDFSTLAGWLTASIAQHGKSEYCRDLARNTTRGLRKRKLAGEWVGSAPIGYLIENGRLAPGDPIGIQTVRTIFEMRASGRGYLAIAKHLNATDVPTPRGKQWSQFTVKHILSREAYLGTAVIGKHSRAKYERLTEGIVRLENNHPPLISQDVWDACRAIDRQLHRAHTRNGSEGAPLSGLLICGRCGSRMYAITQGLPYYICGNYHRHGQCGRCAVPQEAANQSLIGIIIDAFTSADLEAIEREIDNRQKATGSSPASAASLERQLAQVDRKIVNATDRLVSVNDSLVAGVEAKLIELIEQRDRLRASLVVSTPVDARLIASEVAKELAFVTTILKAGESREIRSILPHFIESIRIDFEPIYWKGTKRRFRPTGGVINFTTGCQPLERTSPVCKSASLILPAQIRIDRHRLIAA